MKVTKFKLKYKLIQFLRSLLIIFFLSYLFQNQSQLQTQWNCQIAGRKNAMTFQKSHYLGGRSQTRNYIYKMRWVGSPKVLTFCQCS